VTGQARARRVASAALKTWEREADLVRAEYRRRERQAPGSGDLWLSQRTEMLRSARVADEAAGSFSRSPSPAGVDVLAGTQRADARAYARESRLSTVGRFLGGGDR
jgi:hypothetical protein